MATLGAYSLLANEQRLKFPEVPVSELVAALPEAPQVVQYEQQSWLPTKVAWRRDLDGEEEMSTEQEEKTLSDGRSLLY
jgi:hypothetical protein